MKKKIFSLVVIMMFFSLITLFTPPITVYAFEDSESYSSSLSDFHNFEKELMSELNKTIVGIESISDDSDSQNSDSLEENIFESCRLIVKGNIINNYGAYRDICGYLDYHILCYSTTEQTQYAYYKLLDEEINVRPDAIVETESATSDNYYDYSSYNSWGAKYMDVANYLEYIDGLNNTKETVIAVLDTGINTSHEMFENRILENNSKSLIGFSYYSSTYTYSGYDFEDDNGHGTHVAGIICDLTPSNVKILPIKVLNHEGKAYDSQVLLGYSKIIEEYSLQYNIVCVNTSISGFHTYGSEYVSLLNKNIIPVVASGNDSKSISSFITDNENSDKCVLVSAVKKNNVNSIQFDTSYSNYGNGIDISAPGSNIKSAWIGDNGNSAFTDKYHTQSGTSMATPHVSATVALLSLGLKDGYTTDTLIDRLIDSAIDYGASGYDNYYGYGLVNCKNLQYNKADVTINIKVNNESLDLTKDNTNIRFEENLELTFECSDNSFVIKYTTNNTVPSIYSNTYTQKLNVLTSDNFVNYNIIAYKINGMGVMEEYSSMYNISFAYIDAPIENCVTVNAQGFITEYWGVHNNIVIPEKISGTTITGIDKYVFGWSEHLESIELPTTCKHIGYGAFKTCENLKYIYAPSVKTIDFNAFGHCKSLPFVTSDEKQQNAKEGAYFPALKQFSESYSDGSTYASSGGVFVHCDSVQYIKLDLLEGSSDGSFSNCKSLISCTLPNVTKIDEDFKYCDNLEYVYAPKVTTINQSFAGSKKLELLTTSDIQSTNEKGCFLPSLQTLEEHKYGVLNYAYFKIINLKGVKNIHYLGNLKNLEEIYLYNVEQVADNTFKDCDILNKIVIGENLTNLNTSFIIPSNAVIYGMENTYIHQISTTRNYNFELFENLVFSNNLDTTIEKTENEFLIVSIGAHWGFSYQWYLTEDNINNGVLVSGQDSKSFEITPDFDINKKLFCKVIAWDNSVQYSNIATITFNQSIQTYEIVFKNPDGQILNTKYMRQGQIPVYSGDIPTMDSSEQYDYKFKSWNKEFTEVTGNQEYIAQYTQSIRYYSIKFLNYNGEILYTFSMQYGSTIPDVYKYNFCGAIRESTKKFNYTFKSWDKEFTTITSDQEYVAVYNEQIRSYLIKFVNYDDSVLYQIGVQYGNMPEYNLQLPKRDKDIQYTYEFKGWDKEISLVTGEQIYKAVYENILNKYLITFYNYNNEILQSQLEFYGTSPIYQGETPFRASSATFDYTFSGWDISIQSVSGNTNYYATFTTTPASNISHLSSNNNLVAIEGNNNINEKWKLELNNVEDNQITQINYSERLDKDVEFLTAFKIDIKHNEDVAELDSSNYKVKLTLDDEYLDKKIVLYCLTEDGSLMKVDAEKVDNKLVFNRINNATYIMLEDTSSNNFLLIILGASLLVVIALIVIIVVIKKKKRKAF